MHSISAWNRRELGRGEVLPDRCDALHFAQVGAKLLFGIKVLPTAAALKFANMGKPTLRERVPFRGNLVKADSALLNRH